MTTASVGLAFSRLGADVAGQARPLCAVAEDGSLVLLCQSPGFSRPGAGVLRYSAILSQITGGRSQVETLRVDLKAAHSAGTPVRLIIKTPAAGRIAARVHMRADMVGSVVEFDGDTYSVDFRQTQAKAVERTRRVSRRR